MWRMPEKAFKEQLITMIKDDQSLKRLRELRMRDLRLIISATLAATAFLYSAVPVFALVLATSADSAVLGGSTATNAGTTDIGIMSNL